MMAMSAFTRSSMPSILAAGETSAPMRRMPVGNGWLRNFPVAKGGQVLVIVIVRVVLLIVCVFVRVHSSGCQTRNSAGEAVKTFQRCIGASPLQANRHGYN